MKIFKRLLPVLALLAFNAASCSSMFVQGTDALDDVEIENQKLITNNANSNSPLFADSTDPQPTTYNVTWVNDLGKVLKVDVLPVGATPEFEDTSLLFKASDEDFSYTFSGWEPRIQKVTKDITYTAKYIQESLNFYTTKDYKYNGVALVGVKKIQETVRIPDTINGLPVTQIQFTSNYSWKGISTLVVPNTVIELASFSTENDYDFENVIFGENVEEVTSGLFTNSKTLKSITLSNKLNAISDAMFSGCSNLEEVNFNTNSRIAEIGDHAFEGCDSLKKLDLPESVNKVGYASFSFSGLEEVTFPRHVSTIKGNLFEYSKSLRKVVLPETVEEFNTSSLFNNCENLRDVTLPQNLDVLSMCAFYNCTNLKSLVLPNSIETIERYAIGNNDSLENIVLPQELKTIETCAINGNHSLKYLNVPQKVETIKRLGISSNSNLIKINLPSSLKKLEEDALAYLNSLMVINYQGSVSKFNTISINSKNDVIKSTGINYSTYNEKALNDNNILVVYKNEDGSIFLVNEVNSNANTDVTTYTPTKESDENNSYVFDKWVLVKTNSSGCKEYKATFIAKEKEYGLTFNLNNGQVLTQTLPFNAKITYPAFPENGNLIFSGWDKEITNMPANSLVINANYITRTTPGIVYTKENGFRTFVDFNTAISDKAVSVSGNVFNEALDVYTKDTNGILIMPQYIKEIATSAFDSNKQFKEIILPEGLTKIGDTAFALCGATKINMPSSIKEIGSYAFASAYLEEFKAPNSLETMGEQCFYGAKINSLDLTSDKLNYISFGCFADCPNLVNVVIPSNIKNINNLGFFACDNIETVYCQEGLTTIGLATFSGCTNLREITLPKTLSEVGENVFADCSNLTTINYRNSKTAFSNISIAESTRDSINSVTINYNYAN